MNAPRAERADGVASKAATNAPVTAANAIQTIAGCLGLLAAGRIKKRTGTVSGKRPTGPLIKVAATTEAAASAAHAAAVIAGRRSLVRSNA